MIEGCCSLNEFERGHIVDESFSLLGLELHKSFNSRTHEESADKPPEKPTDPYCRVTCNNLFLRNSHFFTPRASHDLKSLASSRAHYLGYKTRSNWQFGIPQFYMEIPFLPITITVCIPSRFGNSAKS